jgi:ADP-heptose:LPS heptosyltransferase
MPANESDFRNSFTVLDFLDSQNKTLTIFTNDFRVALLPVKFRNKSFSFSLIEISKLKLPTHDLIAKLKKLRFDAVLDLNREENLFSSFVSNIVDSKIRIGMEKKKSVNYYNLIFSDNNFESNIFYSNLLNCLKMF